MRIANLLAGIGGRRRDRRQVGRWPTGVVERRRLRGFTLVELMIVVSIVAILTTIAVPAYQNYIRKSRRPDAKTALLDLASREERYYTLNNSYTAMPANLGYTVLNWPVALGTTADYALSVVTPVGAAAGTTYALQAVPVGDQLNDSCGTYTLDNFGKQQNAYPVGAAQASIPGCW